MKSTLLLFVTLLGAVSGHLADHDQVFTISRLMALDSADVVVDEFLARMKKSLQSMDTEGLSGLFGAGFVYHGCQTTYNKKQIVEILAQKQQGTFELIVGSVKDLGESIKFTAIATGFGPTSVRANFFLDKKSLQLELGVILACPKNHLLGFVAEDSAQSVVDKFVEKMKTVIRSKDKKSIGDIFEDTYEFKACDGAHKKQEIVEFLASISEQAQFAFSVKSVEDVGASIKYTVPITGYGKDATEAVYVLSKAERKLVSGFIPGCQKNQRRGFVSLGRRPQSFDDVWFFPFSDNI